MPGNIANITPQTIAQWPTPNYVNPPSRPWMPIYAGCLYGFSTILIGMRLWLRALKQAGGLGLDDALLAFAWFGSTLFTTVLILTTTVYDADRHAWDIPFPYFEKIALLAWLAQFASLVTGAATKLSVLCFYRRLVAGTYSRRWRWAVIAAIIFTLVWTLIFIFMLIFNCRPTRAYWMTFNLEWAATHNYQCIDTKDVNLLAGIFAAASDLYAVILPCLMTRHFELPRRQKIALNLIFSLGLLVVGASGVRTYYLWLVGVNSDVSWMIFNAYIWAQLELQLSIICASLPALRVFLRKYLAGPFSRTERSAQSSSHRRSGFNQIERKVSTRKPMIEPLQDDYEMKRKSRTVSIVEGSTVSECEMRSRSPSAPSVARLHKGPYTSESYGMDTIDDYERPYPSFERTKSSRGRHNFSQPFPLHETRYDDS